MKKQEYFDMGIQFGLTPSQIEGVLCRIMNISQTAFFTLKDISAKYIYDVQQAFYAFEKGVPEEYTLENANFYGRDFFVDTRVLIPRNDTELLVNKALKKINFDIDIQKTIYMDIGTGSGCIPVSIVKEMYPLKFYRNYAVDLSKEALEVATININKYTPKQITLQESDLLSYFGGVEDFNEKNIFITANLPYIKQDDHTNMDASVILNEPDLALYGGEKTGFELYERLIKQCFQLKQIHKLESIDMFIEIGFDQYDISKNFLTELGLGFEYFQDSANIHRIIHIKNF